jgi:hypothetical protein
MPVENDYVRLSYARYGNGQPNGKTATVSLSVIGSPPYGLDDAGFDPIVTDLLDGLVFWVRHLLEQAHQGGGPVRGAAS